MPLNGYMEIPEEKLSFSLSPEFVGIAAADQVWLNYIIRSHPEWTRCLEFGTYYGLTSVLLGLCMLGRQGSVWTFDITPNVPLSVMRMLPSNVRRQSLNLLCSDGTPNNTVAALLADDVPTLIIMDGGNKVEEVKRYAPLIRSGSAFVVHDWVSELQPTGQVSWAAIRATLDDCGGFTPMALDEAERWNCYFRGWEKRG